MGPPWQGRSIAGPKLRMVEFSAFLEQQRDPESVSSQSSEWNSVALSSFKSNIKKMR